MLPSGCLKADFMQLKEIKENPTFHAIKQKAERVIFLILLFPLIEKRTGSRGTVVLPKTVQRIRAL